MNSGDKRKVMALAMAIFLIFTIPLWLPNLQLLTHVLTDPSASVRDVETPLFGQSVSNQSVSSEPNPSRDGLNINLSNQFDRPSSYNLNTTYSSDQLTVVVNANQNQARLEVDMSGQKWRQAQDQVVQFLRSIGVNVQVEN